MGLDMWLTWTVVGVRTVPSSDGSPIPLVTDGAVIESGRLLVRSLAGQIRQVLAAIRTYNRRIAVLRS